MLNAIIYKVSVLAITMLIGYLSAVTKMTGDEIRKGLSRLITKITMPLMIFTSISGLDLTPEKINNSLIVLISAVIIVFALFSIGFTFSKILKLKSPENYVYMGLSTFGNVIFLAVPVFEIIYGDEGVMYAIFYFLINEAYLWTLGVFLMTRHKNQKNNLAGSLKQLVNPNIIAFGLGIIFLISGLRIPEVVFDSFKSIGGTTIYLAMIFVGSVIAGTDISNLLKRYSLIFLVIVKMLIIPVLIMYILKYIPGINVIAKTVIALQSGMPCMTTFAALCKEFDTDYIFASEGVFITNVLAIGTMPLLYYISTMIFN